MLTYWRAGAGALRGPLVVGLCLVCFVTGSLMSDPTPPPSRSTTPVPTAVITDESVRALAEALDRATASTVPDPTLPEQVTRAEEVLDAVRSGQVHVEPAPPTLAPSTTVPSTTTTVPSTTSTTARPLLDWVTPPSSIVPPPYTEVVQ